MTTQTVTHHGRTTAFRRTDRTDGTEETELLCVHGSGADRDLWRAQRRLADDVPVTAVDLRGPGDRDDVPPDAGYETLAAYADDVAAVAESTGANVLLGSSLGGAVALHVALNRDVAVDGLVLAGTGARLPVLADLLAWLDEDFERAVDFLHRPDHLFHDADEETIAASRETMLETGRAVTARDFRTCHTFDVRADLPSVTAPALAVVGEHDRLTPLRYHEELAAEMPDCDLTVVEGAAHLAMVERPDAFNDAVTSLLERV